MTLRLLTYNLHLGLSPWRHRFKLPEALQAIEALENDVVCLQEVPLDFRNSRQLLEKFERDKFVALSSLHQNPRVGWQGNAIISRFPIVETTQIDLSQEQEEARGLLLAELQIEKGKHLYVGCLHLGLSQWERTLQVVEIEKKVDELLLNDQPLILAGDFNDWRKSFVSSPFLHSRMTESHYVHFDHYARTFPSWLPFFPLDRIYYSGLSCVDIHVHKERRWHGLSDHLPLEGRFRF